MFKTLFSLLAVTLLCFGESSAQEISVIQNTSNRQITSLNGSWKYIVDPYDNGYYSYRYTPRSDGFFKDAKPKGPSDLVEYSFDKSQTLHVPGDWNSQNDKLFFYEGTIWYRKLFDYQLPEGKRLFVHFGAANYKARVYLNGELIGTHEGGFTPFDFEITDKVKAKGNDLVVMVNNNRHLDAIPTVITDWWNYGGLTRDVDLVEVPSTFINNYKVQLDPEANRTVKTHVQLDGSQPGEEITLDIPELKIQKMIKTDASGTADFEVKAGKNMTYWSPKNPKLYTVRIRSGQDTVSDQIGFRTIATQGTDILLNGQPVFLRGICIHEEAPLREGRAYSDEDARVLLTWAKELGANFVRLAHYPHNEHMLKMADKMGIMVWSEIPVYWTIQWDNQQTLNLAKQQLSEVITRDQNHASIILWSMANETPRSDQRLKFISSLAQHTRDLDNTRLVTAALELKYADKNTLLINDPLGKYLDVLGVNEYIGWYDGPPAKADRLSWKSIYNKPMVISEFGGGAKYGNHGPDNERWTEEYQAEIYRHQTKMLQRIPFLAGMNPWILQDFRSPRRQLPDIQDFYNRKGLISDRGFKKEAYYVLQDFYQKLKEQSDN